MCHPCAHSPCTLSTLSLRALSHQDDCCMPTQATAQPLLTVWSMRAVRYMRTHPGTAKVKSLQAFCMLLQVTRNKTERKSNLCIAG